MSFQEDLRNRIMVLDGAMGTMIQRRFMGDNETLNLDDPLFIQSIHKEFIEAGADIIETNSFGANRISQQEYGFAELASQMALRAAQIARQAADESGRKVYVAGSVGPTGKSLTLPSDASDLSFRQYSFDDMVAVFREQISALLHGGVDIILLETCYDALVTKAAIYALEELGSPVPVIISATVSDRSGRTLTGQTLQSFYNSVRHCPGLAAFGINCALGASQMKALVAEISSFSDLPLIFYPNAGIPDEMGRYVDTPKMMAAVMSELAGKGLLNIAGGCCGTTPRHISAVAEAVSGFAPRTAPEFRPGLSVCGLETVTVDRSNNFTNIGERTNVAGSRKFARLISEGKYQDALQVASDQIEGGADIIDINMDDAMLDPTVQMRTFLRYISSEPSVGRAAIMVDSSHFDTIEEALKNAQGRCIVNSISLKDGQDEFLRRARFIRDMGAAMVVMAFDEQGQAVTYERKIDICARAYRLLTAEGIPPQDIIFDPNILTIGTGIAEHARFGTDYIEAVRWIKRNLAGVLTSGGVSNLSFAFRGKNAIREAMHSAFLYHAVDAGLDMAIVNPQMLQIYDQIEPELLGRVEDLIFDRNPDATDRLVEYADSMEQVSKSEDSMSTQDSQTAEERLCRALVRGGSVTLEQDVRDALQICGSPVAVIEGPLMRGMEQVGELFSSGKMFLPQVVRSAKVMQDSVALLKPFMQASEIGSDRPEVVIATVKGDVHDIGKNITSIVLQCSGFRVFDLGVMVPTEDILAKAVEVGADIIAVSGLITPSLFRMEELCRKMSEEGMTVPLFVGGAAASAVHTAVKLSPLYPNVHYGADASASAVMAKKYMADPEGFKAEDALSQQRLRELHTSQTKAVPSDGGIGAGFWTALRPQDIGPEVLPVTSLLESFDWRTFNAVCRVPQDSDAYIGDARRYLSETTLCVRCCVRFYDCCRDGDDIVSSDGELRLPMLRQGREPRLSLSDFFPEVESGKTSPLGIFAISVDGDDSSGLVEHAARVTLAETASLQLQEKLRKILPDGMKLIAPGIGYSCCPDHSLKRDLLSLLPSVGISLTDSCSMVPEASICGLVLAHADAAYNAVRAVTASDLDAYSRRRGFTAEQQSLFLGHIEKV